MEVHVKMDQRGLLPDRYAKYADAAHTADGTPTCSFPFEVTGVPEDAVSLAVAFFDFDSIPVCGFPWIHWVAAGIDTAEVKDGRIVFPEDASNLQSFGMVQGLNSSASRLGGSRNPLVTCRYNGPQPPDKTHVYTLRVYALNFMPLLREGYWANELVNQARGHVLASAEANLPARA